MGKIAHRGWEIVNGAVMTIIQKKFDNELVEYIGADAFSLLSAALWMIDDPDLEKRFAQPGDVET